MILWIIDDYALVNYDMNMVPSMYGVLYTGNNVYDMASPTVDKWCHNNVSLDICHKLKILSVHVQFLHMVHNDIQNS